MKLEQVLQIDITDTIAVSQHKRLITKPLLQPFKTPTSVCFLARILQMDDPILTLSVLPFHATACEVNTEASTQVMVIHEEPFDDFPPVAQRNVKLFKSVVSVVLHDVPEKRPAAYLNHWLWSSLGLFRQTGAQGTCE